MYIREREKLGEYMIYHVDASKLPNKFCVEIHNLKQGRTIAKIFGTWMKYFDIQEMLNECPNSLCFFVKYKHKLEYASKEFYLQYPEDYGEIYPFEYVMACVGGHKAARKVL